MSALDNWPGSIIDTVMTAEAVGTFLRTHRDGHELLFQYLQSLPPDRTEEEYEQERTQAALENERGIKATIARYNERRTAQGLPPIDRKGNVSAEFVAGKPDGLKS